MPSFIDSQRPNIDRLLALILLWNVVAGVFVTLGAPWLAEVAGITGLRSPTAMPSGSGWLAIGVPTHFAGLWLSVLGAYALHRMRRHLPWHVVAAVFYAPQTFVIASPLHVDMRVGLFAMTSVLNWTAIVLFLIHSRCALSGSKFRAQVERIPVVISALARDYWGSTPLSRAALSRRYASIATVAALIFLPLVPAEAFYPSRQAYQLVETQWRVLLLLPVTFVAAYVMAFVLSGGQRQRRFSAWRGVAATLLTYLYLAMAADLLSRWLSGRPEVLFRLFLIAWIYLQPWMLLLPVTGGVTGAWLEKRVQAPPAGDRLRSWRHRAGLGLTLAIPVLALLLGL